MTDKEKEGLKWLSDLYAAAAQGKTIQAIKFGKWTDCVSFDEFPDFDSFNYGFMDDFRIKPEPRRMWVANGIMAYTPEVASGWKSEGYTVTEWVEVT